MKEEIKRRARELGFDECGVTTAEAPATRAKFQAWLDHQRHGEMAWLERNAAKRVDPNLVLREARSIICLAVSYHTEKFRTVTEAGRGQFARYSQYKDYHDVLAEPLRDLAKFVDEQGGAETRSLWYVDTGPILERDLAQRAGIGFVGKHTNLISRRHGNWIFLAEIITTALIPPDRGERNYCGSCSRCIASCPTNAITAPFELDARRCISYLTIELKGAIPEDLRKGMGNRIYGCDDCLTACPWNRFATEARLLRSHYREDFSQANLLEMLRLDDGAFKLRFSGTPVIRTKRRGLLRNVCVALGNTGNQHALPHLRRAAQDLEPLIREHAVWAIAQIESRIAGPNEAQTVNAIPPDPSESEPLKS